MPKQVPLIPDELVLRELDSLAPSICVTASQAAMVLGISVPQLEERRRAGTPPPFISDEVRGKVRYTIGALRDHIRSHTHQSTYAARSVAGARASGMPNSSFAQFAAEASPADLWPFALVKHGRPVDLFRSLWMELDGEPECEWLTLEDFGRLLATAAATEAAHIEHVALSGQVATGATECGKCGKPIELGHCCERI